MRLLIVERNLVLAKMVQRQIEKELNIEVDCVDLANNQWILIDRCKKYFYDFILVDNQISRDDHLMGDEISLLKTPTIKTDFQQLNIPQIQQQIQELNEGDL